MTHKENIKNIVENLPSPPKEFLDSCDRVMEWFKEHNVENLNKALTKQNEPIVIYDLEEFMNGQKLEDDVNVTLPYGVLRKLYNEKCTFEMAYELIRLGREGNLIYKQDGVEVVISNMVDEVTKENK